MRQLKLLMILMVVAPVAPAWAQSPQIDGVFPAAGMKLRVLSSVSQPESSSAAASFASAAF